MERETDRTLIERLNRDAQHIAWRYGLSYRSIEAERANVTSRFGVCYDDGVIKIRLRHAVTGRPLRYSSLVSTLCHELAHLRYFNHGLRFRVFNQQLLEFFDVERLGASAAELVELFERVGAVDHLRDDLVAGNGFVEDLADQPLNRQLVVLRQCVFETRVGHAEVKADFDLDVHRIRVLSARLRVSETAA
jgi:hypothetical protein